MSVAAAAMPPKPNTPATMATIKKRMAQRSMANLLHEKE
jgi:hypothetical protein